MREFRYSALTPSGNTVQGIRMSESKDHLAHELLESGLVLLKTNTGLGILGNLLPGRSTNSQELRDFTQHMATCLSAGITAVTALADFKSGKGGRFAEVVEDIRSDVSSGTQLDDAFARHPDAFSPVFLSLVKAGQQSGNLDEAFEELVSYLEWNENLKSQATQAMIYPSLLFASIIGLFLLMMLFVMPRFKGAFSNFGNELPTLTVKMLAMGDFVGHWWWAILGFMAGSFIGSKLFFKTDRGAYMRDKVLLSAPVVGVFVQKLALSRFAKTFSLIIASGTDLLKVLELMQGVVSNRVMAAELSIIRKRVASGENLTTSFSHAKTFPILIQRLVAVGEMTGSLDRSMMKASDYLDKEIPRDLKKAFTVFEALIIAILGALVCVAALSLLMPIMSIRADM